MTVDDRRAPSGRRVDDRRAVCHKHEALEVSLVRIENTTREGLAEINETLRSVHKDLRDSAINMGEFKVRLHLIEKITYGCVGIALTGLATALLALVLKGG